MSPFYCLSLCSFVNLVSNLPRPCASGRPPPVVFQHGSGTIGSVLPPRTASLSGGGGGKHLRIYGKEMVLLRRPLGLVRRARHSFLSTLFGFLNSTQWSPPLVFFLFFSYHVGLCAYLIGPVSFKVITRGLDFSLAQLVDSFAGIFLFTPWLVPFISSLELTLQVYFMSGLFSSSSLLGEHNRDLWTGRGWSR